MQIGKKQVLKIVKTVDFGVYLGDGEETVLLPKKQVPEGKKPGDTLEVFLYRDSSDRMIATTNQPKIELGGLAVLTVVDTNKYGAFLDWGLEKDLMLPFKQQTARLNKGDSCLVSLYEDKSGRLCATMKVYPFLRTDSPYHKDDRVEGIIYETSETFGVYVAVDNIFSARIPKREAYGKLKAGQIINARVSEVKEDGKLDLSLREKIPEQMDLDAALILERLKKAGGKLPFSDSSDPGDIKEEFSMSKNAFKRALGRLLKQGKIILEPHGMKLIPETKDTDTAGN